MSSTTDPQSSSRPSLAIIITCSAVGGIVFILVFARVVICLHRRRVLKPRPLPPIRPLTIHGASYSAHPSPSQLKLNEGFLESMPSIGVYPSSDGLVSQTPSPLMHATLMRHQSGSTEDTPLRQPSPVTPLSADYAERQLMPPQPLFFVAGNASGTNSNRSSAQVSLSSVTEESIPASAAFQRPVSLASIPNYAQPPEPVESPQIRYSVAAPEGPPSRPKAKHNRHSLATSMSSMRTAETMRSMRSVRSASAIRGAPHNSRNRVEIVLPAPLASQVYPQTIREGAEFGTSAEHYDAYAETRGRRQSTISFSDPWISIGREISSSPAGGRPSSSDKIKVQKEARRASQSRSSRLSLSSSSSHASPSILNPSPYPPSSASSHLNVTPRKSSLELSAYPPVPRVPSMYFTSADSPPSISHSASRENLYVEPLDDASSATRSFHDAPEAFSSTSSFHDTYEEPTHQGLRQDLSAAAPVNDAANNSLKQDQTSS